MMNLYNEEVINLVSDLVKLPSINPDGKEYLVTNYITKLFDKEKIEYQVMNVENDRKNIIAILRGKEKGNGIIFTGHQDVVPISSEEEKRWNYDPFGAEIVGNKLYGRGASDMKGGVGSAIMAMLTLKRNGIVPNRDIILVLTCDEEHYMKGSQKALDNEVVRSAKYCVVCEPTDMRLCYASKGRTWAEVLVYGRTAHGSQKGVGVNAIELCSDLIQEIKNYSFKNWDNDITGESFWQPYAINAGVEPAIVPDCCSMYVDARLTLNHKCDDVWKSMYDIFDELKSKDNNFKADIRVVEKRESWITEIDDYIVKLSSKCLKEQGIDTEFSVFTGTTDGTKFNSIGITPIILGPGNLSVVHKENEYLDLDELIIAYKLYIDIMLNYE